MIRQQKKKEVPDGISDYSVSGYVRSVFRVVLLPFIVFALDFSTTGLSAAGSCRENLGLLSRNSASDVASLSSDISTRFPLTFSEFEASRNTWEPLVNRQRTQLLKWSDRRDTGEPVLFIVVPSLNFDPAEIGPIIGTAHYEQRALWSLLRAAEQNVRVLFVSSSAVPQTSLDELFAGFSQSEIDEIKSRTEMIALNDKRIDYLSDKIADSPEALAQIQRASKRLLNGQEPTAENTFLSGFVNESSMSRLSAALHLPLTGMHPALEILNSKQGNRVIARESKIPFAGGTDSNFTIDEIVQSIDERYIEMKGRGSCFIKANYGASGQGIIKIEFRNAIDTDTDTYADSASKAGSNIVLALNPRDSEKNRRKEILALLQRHSEDNSSLKNVLSRAEILGVVIESGIVHTRAPSVQLEILADQRVVPLSTHMQDMDGPVYKGASQPAYGDIELESKLMSYAVKYAETLARYGVVGRIGLDFFEVEKNEEIDFIFGEANIREGGTTHPWETVARFLRASYDANRRALISSVTGQPVFYKMTDNFVDRESFQNLSLLELWAEFKKDSEYPSMEANRVMGTGVKFHMMSALPEFGKIGFTAFARSKQEAADLFEKAKRVLLRSAKRLREKSEN
ncbi:MAG: hypothetical protein IPJ71_03010 [Bdellovibrionales bacterium]|nr:hypothetical protein [Bdellovibrionales bacterium]